MYRISHSFLSRALLVGAGFALTVPVLAGAAHAQVTTNQDALSELKPADGAAPAKASPSKAALSKPAQTRAAPVKPTAHATAPPAPDAGVQQRAASSAPHPVLRSAPLPPIPPAPPPQPVFVAPSVYVPLHPMPVPADVPAVADAKGDAAAIAGGQRLIFGAGSADLNAGMRQAVLAFAADLVAHPDARADIDAYADGTSDDLSTPRRLSLSRGLAVRAILMHAGVASTRIYVRPIGLLPDTGASPDRLDLTRSDLVPSHHDAAPAASAPLTAAPKTGKATP